MASDLKTLRNHLEFNGVEIKEFTGYSITTKKGVIWELAHDTYFKDGAPVTEKEMRVEYPKRKS